MGVKCISKLANIYYVPNIEAVNAIQAACDIEFIEENKPIDYTLPIIDEHKEDFTLFSEDAAVNKDDTITYRMNDNYYRLQWGYEAVNAYAYYDNNIRGQDVKIGIIDTGLNIQGIGYPNGYQVCNELYIDTPNEATEDLRNLKFEGLNMIAYIKNETDRLKYLCNGSTHGTSVTGIIVASANNNAGIAGMTGLCSVFFYKNTDPVLSQYMYGEIEALERCYEDGCRVINMSFGANFSSKSENKLFRELKKKGIILIASAGNNGVINSETTEDNLNSYSYPACDESVIAVGAVQPSRSGIEIEYYTNNLTGSGQTGHKRVTWTTSIIETLNNNQYEKCDFSTANDSVFISAPGRDIYTLGGIAYSYCSGTSIAAPIVSAAAIGVKQMRPYVDTDMFKEILKATSVDLDEPGYDINTGWGMVDFQAIYDYVSRMPEAIVEDTPNIEIDYENSTLKGISDEKVYQVNGEEITPHKWRICHS